MGTLLDRSVKPTRKGFHHMIQRLLGSAAVAALFIASTLCSPAYADVVELRDGTFRPKSLSEVLEPGQVPSFEQLRKARSVKVEPSFSSFKVGRESVSASQIVAIYSSESIDNSDFNAGETHGASENFEEAATSFEAAVDSLKSSCGKQVALHKAMIAWQASGNRNVNAMLAAADAILAQFPKGYYVPAAQTLRARIFASQGKAAEAKAALDSITGAVGMNARDFFEAELTKISWYKLRRAGNDAKKLGAAEKAYRDLVRLATSKGKDADIQALKARVGAGRALVYQGKYANARKEFEAVTGDNRVTDQRLLASAYNGLGDAVYAQAKADDKNAGGDAAKKEAVYAALTDAALHYLRVTELYGDAWGPDEMLSATQNLARVFANQFSMQTVKDGDKDAMTKRCKLGERAYAYYRSAWQRMGRGESKNLLAREAKDFKAQLDATCKAPEPKKDK